MLQRVKNNMARVVCQRGGRTDASPLTLITLLVACQTMSHLQDGVADEGGILLGSSIPEHPDPDDCSCPARTVI